MKYSKGSCSPLTAFALLVLPMLSVFSISHALAGEGKKNSFRDDVSFLEKYVRVVVLSDKSGQAQVAVVPSYQGRVMTSTAAGPAGMSFGWINYGFIASGEKDRHMNVYGAEARRVMDPCAPHNSFSRDRASVGCYGSREARSLPGRNQGCLEEVAVSD